MTAYRILAQHSFSSQRIARIITAADATEATRKACDLLNEAREIDAMHDYYIVSITADTFDYGAAAAAISGARCCFGNLIVEE